eukprot:15440311-Alexandrium_andersonii.AAC.1
MARPSSLEDFVRSPPHGRPRDSKAPRVKRGLGAHAMGLNRKCKRPNCKRVPPRVEVWGLLQL